MSDLLVSPEWLSERLPRPDTKVVDGSWYLPVHKKDGRAEFLAGHIPGAVFFDVDLIADRSTGLPHMLPDDATFAEAAGALGLSDTDIIVVYDGLGLFSAARVWWTIRVFGAKRVKVLEGGLPAWKQAGLPLESGEAKPRRAVFKVSRAESAVRTIDDVKTALRSGAETVLDARPAARFRGEAPEPRPGISSGHMPGALSLPSDQFVDQSGRLRDPEQLRQLFEGAGVDLAQPVITTCGSGVTAALALLALNSIGKDDVTLYDGSWAEWASRPDAEIAKGPK